MFTNYKLIRLRTFFIVLFGPVIAGCTILSYADDSSALSTEYDTFYKVAKGDLAAIDSSFSSQELNKNTDTFCDSIDEQRLQKYPKKSEEKKQKAVELQQVRELVTKSGLITRMISGEGCYIEQDLITEYVLGFFNEMSTHKLRSIKVIDVVVNDHDNIPVKTRKTSNAFAAIMRMKIPMSTPIDSGILATRALKKYIYRAYKCVATTLQTNYRKITLENAPFTKIFQTGTTSKYPYIHETLNHSQIGIELDTSMELEDSRLKTLINIGASHKWNDLYDKLIKQLPEDHLTEEWRKTLQLNNILRLFAQCFLYEVFAKKTLKSGSIKRSVSATKIAKIINSTSGKGFHIDIEYPQKTEKYTAELLRASLIGELSNWKSETLQNIIISKGELEDFFLIPPMVFFHNIFHQGHSLDFIDTHRNLETLWNIVCNLLYRDHSLTHDRKDRLTGFEYCMKFRDNFHYHMYVRGYLSGLSADASKNVNLAFRHRKNILDTDTVLTTATRYYHVMMEILAREDRLVLRAIDDLYKTSASADVDDIFITSAKNYKLEYYRQILSTYSIVRNKIAMNAINNTLLVSMPLMPANSSPHLQLPTGSPSIQKQMLTKPNSIRINRLGSIIKSFIGAVNVLTVCSLLYVINNLLSFLLFGSDADDLLSKFPLIVLSINSIFTPFGIALKVAEKYNKPLTAQRNIKNVVTICSLVAFSTYALLSLYDFWMQRQIMTTSTLEA